MENTTPSIDATAIADQISGLTDVITTLGPAMLGVGIAIFGFMVARKFIR